MSQQARLWLCEKETHLFPLVRFGDTRVWNNFHSIHFACSQICKFVAFGKATLVNTNILGQPTGL